MNKKKLTPEQYNICREKGTELAFSGKYWDLKDKGIYSCICCDIDLFSSDTKFDSGTGWPSFFKPLDEENIEFVEDNSFGMKRVEVNCKNCGGHLGHVFDDGPNPTNMSYCINSVSLDLDKSN